jgi:hypothetical protein
MLHYNQTYYWIIGYNDTASNTGFSDEFNFTVMDNYLPDIIVPAQQTTNYPEYDESNTISITLTEPSDASQVDKIVLCYKLRLQAVILFHQKYSDIVKFMSGTFYLMTPQET